MEKSLQTYASYAVDLCHLKIVMRYWKICEYVTMIHLHIFLHQHKSITSDSYDGNVNDINVSKCNSEA